MWKAAAAAAEYADNRMSTRSDVSTPSPRATPAWDHFRACALDSARAVASNAESLASGSSAVSAGSSAGAQPSSPNAAAGFLHSLGTQAIAVVERKAKQAAMPNASSEQLQLALFGTRLADLAYLSSESELQAGLARLAGRPELLHFQRQATSRQNLRTVVLPQWFIARSRDAAALYVVFRGTASTDDVLRDLMASPVAQGPLRFHGGFLGGVRDDTTLRAMLGAYLDGASTRLYLVGHSLGGSLALVLPCLVPSLVPPSFAGRITVVAIGSPPVLHGPLDAAAAQQPAAATSPARALALGAAALPPAAARCRALVVVNAADAVPRVLGSPMPLSAPFLAKFARQAAESAITRRGGGGGGGGDRERVRAASQALLRTLPDYVHLSQTEVVLVQDGGDAISVPPTERHLVLHLHESLSPNALQHHHTEEYVKNLEAAVRRANAQQARS